MLRSLVGSEMCIRDSSTSDLNSIQSLCPYVFNFPSNALLIEKNTEEYSSDFPRSFAFDRSSWASFGIEIKLMVVLTLFF